MLKRINQLLKLVGLNLVHAKRVKARKPYTAKELLNTPYTGRDCVPSPDCCQDEYNAKEAKKSPYVYVGNVTGRSPCGDAEQAYIDGCKPSDNKRAADDGHTHYVGDGCKPAHVDASPTQDNNITGQSS